MEEDYNMRAAAPGLGYLPMSARGWAQYRSRIQNYPASVRWSWGVAGALDSLRNGNVDECRARLCLMLAQADQQSIDRGSWLLCQEIALEAAPPYSNFQIQKQRNNNSLGFWTRGGSMPLWPQSMENDDYVERRRKLGSRSTRKEGEEPAPKPNPKGKAKGKSGKDATSQHGGGKGQSAPAANADAN